MKTRLTGLAVLGLAALFASSCGLTMPTKLQVKATPTVNAPFGSKEYLISDEISLDDIKSSLEGSSTGVEVYDYQDAEDIQKFMMYYPLTEVDLDFSTYMSDMATSSVNFDSQTIPVPAVAISTSNSTTFDVSSTMIASANSTLGSVTAPFYESNTSVTLTGIESGDITSTTFDSVTFSAGSLNLNISLSGASAGLVVSVDSAAIQNASGTTLSASTSAVDVTAGGLVTIPLANVTLTTPFSIVFTITQSGGVVTATPIDLAITPSLSVDTKITAATGVDFSDVVTINVTAPVNAGSSFIGATVASTANSGSLVIDTGAFPANWIGFAKTTDISITQAAVATPVAYSGFNPAAKNGQSTQNVSFDLTGQDISNQDMAVTVTVHISAANGSFDNLPSAGLTMTSSASASVSEFADVTVALADGMSLSQEYREEASDDMKQWVEWIDLTKAGISLNLTTNLPTGNTISATVVSNEFGINQTHDLVSGSDVEFVNGDGTVVIDHFVPNATPAPELDFAVDIGLPGYIAGATASDPSYVTLHNLVPGNDLTFAASATILSDWSQISINPQTGYSGMFPEDGSGLDLGAVNDILGDGIGFSEVPAHLYLSGLGTSTKLYGTLQATWTGGSAEYMNAPTAADTNAINFVTEPDFTSGLDATDPTIFNGTLPTSSLEFDLSEALNAGASDLVIDYNLLLTPVTLNKADVETGTQLKAEMVMILPLSLSVAAGGAELDISSYMDPLTEDVFGRSDINDDAANEDINRVLDSLSALSLNLHIINNIGIAVEGTLYQDITPLDTVNDYEFLETISIPDGENDVPLTLDSADVQFMQDNLFIPQFTVVLPNSTDGEIDYGLRRGGSISIGVTATVTTNVDQVVEF